MSGMREVVRHAQVCVRRKEDFASRGTWIKTPVTRAGVLVVRGDDSELRAFHAVCPHRGSMIPLGTHGCA